MRKYDYVIGSEQRGKGTNVELGPTVNIVRDPRWGRAFESFGENPYLASQIGVADIQRIQSQGPMAQVKHYLADNHETNRFGDQDNVVVSDRAPREIYTPAFEAAVKGLDMEMPDSKYFGSALTTAVNNGQVAVATINDKVRHHRRIRLGQVPRRYRLQHPDRAVDRQRRRQPEMVPQLRPPADLPPAPPGRGSGVGNALRGPDYLGAKALDNIS
jgi:beta-glucosidase-like glycosyl hydrolase